MHWPVENAQVHMKKPNLEHAIAAEGVSRQNNFCGKRTGDWMRIRAKIRRIDGRYSQQMQLKSPFETCVNRGQTFFGPQLSRKSLKNWVSRRGEDRAPARLIRSQIRPSCPRSDLLLVEPLKTSCLAQARRKPLGTASLQRNSVFVVVGISQARMREKKNQ